MKSENKDKLEIWLAPRFVIEKKLKSSASHFKPIMANWKEETAPIGILWSMGDWEDLSWYDYNTSAGCTDISSKNLYETWVVRATMQQRMSQITAIHSTARVVMFVCEPK